MANLEDENPDSDQLDLPGAEPTEAEMFGELGSLGDDVASQADQDQEAALPTDEDEKAESGKDEKEDKEKKGGLLKALTKADPYTVMLGLALLAILTAISCLCLELKTYHFDVDASDYKQRAE